MSLKVKVTSLSRVRLFATPWTVTRQAPLSIGFSMQEYWSGLLCPLPGDLPNPGIEPRSPALQADSLLCEPPGKPRFYLITSLRDESRQMLEIELKRQRYRKTQSQPILVFLDSVTQSSGSYLRIVVVVFF